TAGWVSLISRRVLVPSAPAELAAVESGESAPAKTPHQEERDQQQQRQETHALGDDADSGRDTAEQIPAPGGSEKQMAQQRVDRQRDQETQHRVDLCPAQCDDEM